MNKEFNFKRRERMIYKTFWNNNFEMWVSGCKLFHRMDN
jgi:hypothetical protein